MNAQPAYNFDDAKYAKNCIAVTIPSDDGWKTPAGIVASEVKARFKYAFQDVCKHPATRIYSWFAFNHETGKKDILCAGCSDCGKVLAGGAE